MRKAKKNISVFLSLALIIGSMGILPIVSKASNPTPVTLTLTGAAFDGGGADKDENDQVTTHCSNIWLAGNANGIDNPVWNVFRPIDETDGIWLDEERATDAGLINHNGQGGWFATGFTATAGQTITIKGTFKHTDSDSYVEVEEVKFKWTGSSWKEVAEETTTYQSFTYDGIDGATGYSDDSSFWNVYLHPTIEVPGTAWSTSFTGLQVQVGDGDPFDVAVQKTNHEGTTYFTIGSDKLPKAVEKGTKVIVKAGKADPNEGTEGIELTEDFVMYALGNGEGFTTEEPTTYTTFNVTGFVNYGPNCGYDGSKWNLYLTTDSELPGTAWEEAFPVTVAVDGTEITIAAKQGNDSRQLYMSIPGSTLTNGADATVVIKAGEYDCTDSNKKIGYKIATDFTFYSSKHGWSTSDNILDANVTKGISLRLSVTSHGPSFSVDTNKNDGVTASDDWFQKIYAVRNESSTADALYFDNENGVKIDGVDQKKPLPLVKLLDTTYYVALHDVLGSTLANGDYTVGGVFRDVNGKLVEFYPITVNYVDGTWTEIVSQTDLQYDVNGNNTVDSTDLVRLLRYCNDNNVAINRLQADINGDGVIDRNDIGSLRKVLVGSISYSGTEGGNAPVGIPTYNNTKTVERMAYICPSAGTWTDGVFTENPNLDEELQQYKEAGFTLLNSEFVAPLMDDDLTEEKQPALVYYLEQAKKNGLGVIVSAPWLNSLLKNGNSETDIPNFNQTLGDGSSYWKAILSQYVSFLKQYPAFKGFMMSDELPVQYAENYATIVRYLKELDPSLNLHSSQLPAMAYDVDSFGASSLTKDTTTNDTKEKAYKDYVTNFALSNGMFTYDLYALYSTTTSGNTTYSVDDEWYTNLRYVADVAKENGFKTGISIQSCQLTGTSSWWKKLERYAPTQKADIGFQVYTAMAYGAQEINFYTYMDHPTDTTVENSIALNADVKNAVRAVNTELASFGNVFKAFTWKDTLDIATGGSNTTTGNARLASVSAADARALVGCMKDSDGFDGYMVANAEGPRTGKTARVTLTFNSATKAMIYKGTSCETVSLTGGVCTVTLAAGEGAFVIPIR